MINWEKYFDRIYCIHYVKHTERVERIQQELKRVGILNSNIFQWELGYDSPFFKVLQKNINFCLNEDISKDIFYGAFKCSLSHYSIMKNADFFQRNRILILEDDTVFLKDVSEIQRILDGLVEHDICLFDKFTYNPNSYETILNDPSTNINGMYRKFDNRIDFGSSACYSLSKKAIEVISEFLESNFCASDHIWNNYCDNLKNLNRVFSVKNLSRQKNYTEHNYKNFFNEDIAYNYVKLNQDEY